MLFKHPKKLNQINLLEDLRIIDSQENINKISDLYIRDWKKRENADIKISEKHFPELDNKKIDLTSENS